MFVPASNIIDSVDLTANDSLLPMFECVANSILSIKKAREKSGYIQIHIERGHYPIEQSLFAVKTIKNLTIIDNGEGFTDINLKSFEVPFSKLNKRYGCKGIGRFTMLAAFKQVFIKSTYIGVDGNYWYRELEFDAEHEVHIIKQEPSKKTERKTIIQLIDCFNPAILNHTALKTEDIATDLMNHCLVYYLCGDLPTINVYDKESNTVINIQDLFSKISKENIKAFEIKGHKFTMYITKSPKENNRRNHYIHYCANSRTVGNARNIAKRNTLFCYPILYNNNLYFLDVYVVSDYLNANVLNTRNGFKIPSEREDVLFNSEQQITLEDIDEKIIQQLQELYDSHVRETRERSRNEIKKYIQTQAPRYNSFLRNDQILDTIPPNLNDDKKEEFLYKLSFDARKKIDEKLNSFIEKKQINPYAIESIKQDLKNKTAYDTDSLADYMFRRKAIIKLFDKLLDADANGKYKLEKDIHNLIFPMGLTNNEVNYESHNLWLLDERFTTYQFIASDKSITSICQKKSSKEPDLLLLNSDDFFDNRISFGNGNVGEISSLVIFEFKRPGDTAHQKTKNNYRWEFSELLDKYFDDFIYNENKKNYKGQHVIVDKATPKFGYIIMDVIPKSLADYNEGKGWHKTPFNSYYKIIDGLNLHIEVLTFRQLIKNASERHNPFFNKLFTTH